MILDPAHLSALRAAVDEGTFEAAARTLSVTPSAVSQRIKALETSVGRVLLRRSKPVTPTESGRAVLRLARQLEALSADVADELGAGAAVHPAMRPGAEPDIDADADADAASDVRLAPPRPALRLPLAVNADSLATWFLPALAPLAGTIAFELVREDESHTAELLRDGAVMAAVTAVAAPVQGCSSTLLGSMRYRPMATPAFAERWLAGPPPVAGSPDRRSGGSAGLTGFADAPVVVFDRRDELQHRFLATLPGGEALDPPRHYVPGSADFVEAVGLGFGWGMIPDLQRPDAGLVDLAPGAFIDVPLYWQQWQLRTRALELAAAAVREAAARSLRKPRA